ncbi:MAG: AbrB/MazE/SpoVT family DNA-binding domain-containing protein [Candidatus Aenigmarchaeota archaeon]|nr:AbrB/MazE/SpoVT family DNA-binding domain-containing protein [Candidatus Aenigmarchaeota archaeon]
MGETQSTVKKWGSSLGVVIPIEVVKQKGLREGDTVVLEISKKNTIREIFGSLKHNKLDSQKIKDNLRKEWSKW